MRVCSGGVDVDEWVKGRDSEDPHFRSRMFWKFGKHFLVRRESH